MTFEEAQELAAQFKQQALDGKGSQQDHPQTHPGDDDDEND